MPATRRRFSSRSSLPRLAVAIGALALTALAGCNVIDVVIGRHARIEKMVPGGNVATGELDCWLTMEFLRIPKGVNPRDVKVRFESIALVRPAEFDWSYIAENDWVSGGGKAFGSGHRHAEHTSADQDPPLKMPSKVRFPLMAKRQIDNASSAIMLEAHLYWGGKKQDSHARSIEHVYSRTGGGFF